MLNRIRYFNKRVTNRITLKIAGAPHSPISLIRHQGRRSGKPYETPVMVERTANGFIFALTYGPKVDWYRNILAAGSGTLRWMGKEYTIDNLQIIDARTGQAAFGMPVKFILRLLGRRHFFQMRAQEVAPVK
jgi:deazaflavin-dependent oxidoreductase (nitroreductase family)